MMRLRDGFVMTLPRLAYDYPTGHTTQNDAAYTKCDDIRRVQITILISDDIKYGSSDAVRTV